MNLKSPAVVFAIVLLVAACGGGGGGAAGGGGVTVPPPVAPPTTVPVVAGVATFAGSRGDYSIVRTTGGYTVTDRRTNGVANVAGAVAIRFADVNINLAIGDKAIAFQMARVRPLIALYVALLNQVPDADTLSVWIDRFNSGMTMVQAADSLYAQAILAPGVSGYAAQMLNDEFVIAVYKGVFGRSAVTATEVQAWSSRIDKVGISRGALVQAMLEAARSGSADLSSVAVLQLLDNKIAAGEHFAVQQGINYNLPEESLARRVAIASAVTATDITAAQAIIGFSDASFNLVAGK